MKWQSVEQRGRTPCLKHIFLLRSEHFVFQATLMGFLSNMAETFCDLAIVCAAP